MRDKIRNEDLRARKNAKDVIKKAVEAKDKWAGNIAGKKRHGWAKKTTKWAPLDRKRAKGRPKIRRRDEIEKKLGSAESTGSR